MVTVKYEPLSHIPARMCTAPTLRQLRSALQKWKTQTQDKGFLPEDAAEAQKGCMGRAALGRVVES